MGSTASLRASALIMRRAANVTLLHHGMFPTASIPDGALVVIVERKAIPRGWSLDFFRRQSPYQLHQSRLWLSVR